MAKSICQSLRKNVFTAAVIVILLLALPLAVWIDLTDLADKSFKDKRPT